MSDATLPPPRSSSVAPATGDGNRSDSSAVEHEHGSDTSFTQSTGHNINEDGAGGLEGRPSNKQKRKRTRYAWIVSFEAPETLAGGSSSLLVLLWPSC